MNRRLQSYLVLFLISNVSLFQISEGRGQIRSKLSRVRVELGTGHDTNLFRVASQNDSNRVESQAETLEGKISWWTYWKRGVKTYFSSSGNYYFYPNNTFANEWKWKVKSKTDFAIRNRASGFLPEIDLNINLGGMRKDQIFTSRELGGENFRDIDEDGIGSIALGDLFDRTSYFFGGGLDFKFNRKISLSLDYVREIKNYRDIADPASQTLSSLDNIENNFEADVYFRPSKLIKVKLSYDGQDRLYQHKLARDGNGMRTPNTNRRYWTNLVDLNFYLLPRRASAKFSASVKQRKDRFSDYHDYLQTELEGSLELTMSMYSYLDFNIERSWKDYDKLEVSGSTLSNRYLTIEASIGFFMTRNVTLQAQYVHDRESSTADVFNYHRNIVLAKLRYSLD